MPMPTSTPAIDYSASIGSSGADLFSGPGENYPKTITLQGDVTIIGQAYSCSWFKVASVSNSTDIGWISADNLTYSVNCSDVKLVAFPPAPQPTPTDTPLPSPTATATKAASIPVPPGSPNVNCEINSNIIIQNRSSDPFTLVLSGTANFTFYIGAGEYTTEKVCSGSYNYIVYGTCNGAPATGSGRISDGDQVYFVCN